MIKILHGNLNATMTEAIAAYNLGLVMEVVMIVTILPHVAILMEVTVNLRSEHIIWLWKSYVVIKINTSGAGANNKMSLCLIN